MFAEKNKSLISIRSKSELADIAEQLFRKDGSAKILKINSKVLRAFISEVGRRYKNNPYHNFQHAVDTTNNMLWLLNLPTFKKNISPFHRFMLLVSALVHDVEHPGNDNQWELKTNSELARRYKVNSVLEQHSLWVFQEILKKDGMNIFESFEEKELKEAHRLMGELILCTDFSCHSGFIRELSEGVKKKPIKFTDPKTRSLVIRSLIKAADIGNTAKTYSKAKSWGMRVIKEYRAQGAREKKAKLPVGVNNDPSRTDFYTSQAGFIKNQTMALFELMTEMEPKLDEVVRKLEKNHKAYLKNADRNKG